MASQKKGYAEALELRESIVEYFKDKYPADETNDEILDAMKDLVNLLEYNICDYRSALIVRQEIFRLLKLKGDANKILDSGNRIANLLHNMEDYVSELDWRERILEFCLDKFVEDSPEVIGAMEKLSDIYEEVGEYDVAERLRREIVNLQAENHGNEAHRDVIEATENIADQLQAAGRYDEELAVRQELVELYRRHREENGGDSSLVTNALYDVAALFDLLGYSQEAYAARLEIVEEYKKDYDEIVSNEFLGEHSAEALSKLESLAKALHGVEDYEQELIYRQKIVDFCKAVDENSGDTVNALYALADVYHAMSNEDEERKITCQILEIHKKILNDLRASSADDELIITALQDIAALEMDLGNVDETNRLEGEILSIRRNAVKKFEDERGKTDPDTLGALEKLADTLAKYNHFDEELTVRRELLERLKAYPEDEIIDEILKIKDAVAVALDNQNDFCAALKVRQEILSIYRKYFDDTDDEVIQALSKVADAFKKLDDYRAVLKTRREIVKIYEEKFPDDKANSDLIEARINESDILIELEDFDAALDIYLESVELYTKKYGKSGYKHDDTLDVRHKIARLYVRKKDFENAVNEYEEIISLLKENYSESHHKAIKLTSELDDLREKINSADFGLKSTA